jgi:hypothetical protein
MKQLVSLLAAVFATRDFKPQITPRASHQYKIRTSPIYSRLQPSQETSERREDKA